MTDDTSHFQEISWVAQLLSDPSFITIPIPSRIFKSSTEDSFFSTTINSPSTIAKCLMQYRQPEPESKPFSPEAIPTNELRIFCTLGSDLNGYPGVLHGGMISTLLDECTGLVLSLSLGGGLPGMEGPVTAYLNTRFKRPVLTPGTVLVSARIVETKENRKWKLVGDIRDENGKVLSEAECLYILPRGAGNKL
ncbi:HotDog domain-containing protein [Aspergillus unguis]